MITINETGNVSFTNKGDSYDLSVSEEYKSFLIWITSPDETQKIERELFDIDSSTPSEEHEKLNRYSDFLKAFLEQRNSILSEATKAGRSNLQRTSEIESLIAELKGEA